MKYDDIIIGGGLGGLVATAFLSKAKSSPLTPPCVPFGTRRFNSLSAVPCICGVCHHTRRMQGIRL